MIIIHEIHDTSNSYVIDLMKKELGQITDERIIQNYHPDYANYPGNLFFILDNGRYARGRGKYFVLEEAGQFITGAGWNEYELEPAVALALSRAYTVEKYRLKFNLATHLLPKIITETDQYEKIWITFNEYNKGMYEWFVRTNVGKRPTLFSDWPEIYKNFKPIGKKNIYYTTQYVVEFDKGGPHD